jgi:hypothetical protein
MINEIRLPEEINISIGSEAKDFSVKSGPIQAYGKSFSNIIFGLTFLGFGYFILTFLPEEFFKGEAIRIIKESVSKTAATEESKGTVFVFILFLIMLFVGLYLMIPGFVKLFKSGGYFVATPSRLLNYRKGHMSSFDWGQFNGNIEVHGTNKRGSISLEMKTGYMITGGKGGSRYVPNEVYISSVAGIYEIEQICRKRIKENDQA